ncbi:hypothetical protein U9M48_036041, partial [Paspalum notatum var. saurae]
MMPFGLTNTPATFQALMNLVLQPFLRRFVLVFLNDILMYISWSEHLHHICLVQCTLQEHRLFLKRSKCSLGTQKVWLTWVMSSVLTAWPWMQKWCHIPGWYYRRFIKNYSALTSPLTQKGCSGSFLHLSAEALITAPILQIPDFNKSFIVECDASKSGFGVGSGAIAFFSRLIAARHLKLAVYERKLIGLVQTMKHWRSYLWGREFLVRKDHHSLKFLLDQCLSTIPQHQWASKFKPGHANVVANSLSRHEAFSAPQFDLFDEILQAIVEDQALEPLKGKAKDGTGRLVHASIISTIHDSGHEGIQKMLQRLKADFFIPQIALKFE